jgi:hypothetical protein
MKLVLLKNIIFLLSCAMLTASVYGQDDCLLVLKKAQKNYEEGIIESIPNDLSGCIKSGLNGKDKVAAYKLLINVYLFDDRKDLANEMMVDLLTYEPEMKPNELIDSKEFITLFESYRTIPLYSIGVTAGINYSQIGLLTEFGTYNTDLYDGTYSSPDFGFQVGLNANYLIKNNLYANIEALFSNNKFNYFTELNSFSTLEFNESQSTLFVPLTLSYHFGKRRLKPTLKLGGYGVFNFSSSSEFVRTYTDNSQNNITGPRVSMSDMRNKLTYGLIGSLGVKYKVKEAYWFLDAGYAFSLKSSVDATQRISNNELVYEYQYVDDDFKVSNLIFSIGYKRLFYKPKKLKHHE